MISEIVLLTRSYNEDELSCWLNWHLNVVHFDRVSVLDNDSTINVKSICDSISSSRISHKCVHGDGVRQFDLYTDYIKTTDSNWVIALDDDEFFYVGERYNHCVNNLIEDFYSKFHCNKCYAQWVNLYSLLPMDHKDGLYLDTHTYYSFDAAQKLISVFRNGCNRYGKCLFRNEDGLIYKYRLFARRWVGHSPQCLNGDDTLKLVSGEILESDWVPFINEINSDCFVAHYQFKNREEWKIKCCRPSVAAPDFFKNRSSKVYIYNEIYKYSSLFKPCTLIKDLYNKSINNSDCSGDN